VPVTKPTPAKAILIGLELKKSDSLWSSTESLLELKELSRTAGLDVVEFLSQTRESPHPRSYIGKGKIDELREIILEEKIEVLVTDDELHPSQQKNLEQELNIKIIDRTGLILDIFASRARTAAAKLQVELAQLDYLVPRLTRLWTHLSRTGGGIGTRGPGEKQLEVDRRAIQTRISKIKKELKQVERHRNIQRSQRHKLPVLTAAIVGYTNAGKSTLLNRLTKAGVVAEDKLFATLDPTTRKIRLENNEEILLTDTVGFIQKLPHQLVDAFHATLEEVVDADFLIHVVDASHPKFLDMIETSADLLEELGASDKPMVMVFNKSDQIKDMEAVKKAMVRFETHCVVSALKSEGIESLYKKVESLIQHWRKPMTFYISYDRMDIVSLLHRKGKIISEEYEKDIKIKVEINKIVGEKILGQLNAKAP